MAAIFPEWITLGQQNALLRISHDASPEVTTQVLHYVGEYRRRVPQGIFKENDDFSAILKTIVDLDSDNLANSREAQLQNSSQDSFDECELFQRKYGRQTSQSMFDSYIFNVSIKHINMYLS